MKRVTLWITGIDGKPVPFIFFRTRSSSAQAARDVVDYFAHAHPRSQIIETEVEEARLAWA
jgi:hypothetical protein